MRGRNRNAEIGRAEQRDCPAGLGAESLHRGQARDLRAHRVHDAPAAEQRAQAHRGLTGDHHPERHVEFAAQVPLRVEQHRDDAHGLLRVVAAVAERIERRRDELQVAEGAVDRSLAVARRSSHDTARISISARKNPVIGDSTIAAAALAQSGPDHRGAAGLGHAGADQSADQRMRAARRNAGPPGDQVPARSPPSARRRSPAHRSHLPRRCRPPRSAPHAGRRTEMR